MAIRTKCCAQPALHPEALTTEALTLEEIFVAALQ